MKAIDKFHDLENGILGIIRAADLYACHAMAKIRNKEIDMQSINSIMSGTKVSGFNIIGDAYKKDEFEILKSEKHFTAIGQQIIVASHTALETYLILKFKEYYKFTYSDSNSFLVTESLKKIHFRDLKDFKNIFKSHFNIHIPSFEIDYYSSNGCNFKPKNTWEALTLICDTRNDIVHKGTSIDYEVTSLMDSWHPFEFVRRWVTLFDANFDSYIYLKKETKSYREHKQRAHKNGTKI